MGQEFNGRVTLAIVQHDLLALADVQRKHDERNAADLKAIHDDIKDLRDALCPDHDKLTEIYPKVKDMDNDIKGLKRENRIWSGLAGIIALVAAALGIQKP